MSEHHYDHIRNNPKFHVLIRSKARLSWTLCGLMWCVYFAFILLVAFYPEVLAHKIAAGSIISWGIPLGLAVIIFTIVLTGMYVHRANTSFDQLTDEVVAASDAHVLSLRADQGR